MTHKHWLAELDGTFGGASSRTLARRPRPRDPTDQALASGRGRLRL